MKYKPSAASSILVEDEKTSRLKKHLHDLENLVGWLKSDAQELDKEADSTLGKVGSFFLGAAVGSHGFKKESMTESLAMGTKIKQTLKDGTIRYGEVVRSEDSEGTGNHWTGILFDGEDEDESNIGWFQNDEWKKVGITKA